MHKGCRRFAHLAVAIQESTFRNHNVITGMKGSTSPWSIIKAYIEGQDTMLTFGLGEYLIVSCTVQHHKKSMACTSKYLLYFLQLHLFLHINWGSIVALLEQRQHFIIDLTPKLHKDTIESFNFFLWSMNPCI